MKTMIHYIRLLIYPAVFFIACSIPPKELEVHVVGSLKKMTHLGDVSSKINMDTLTKYEHLYALGALENLKGEVLILDAKSWTTSVENKVIKFHSTLNNKAALLVYANINEWIEFALPKEELAKDDLEEVIYSLAFKNNINTENPFPFLIKGVTKSLKWHVIDWKEGDLVHNHEKHMNSGLHGSISNDEVEILGFYSQKHQTIFTHYGSEVHLHFKSENNKIAGHVDDVTIGNNMKLYLPKN